MKHLLLSLLLIIGISSHAAAQSFDVPAKYSFSKPDDYAQYEPQVISTINWLEETPANQDLTRRQQAQRFLLAWGSGSPKVSIGLQPYVGELAGKNVALLMAFMGGWTRYSLQHADDKNTLTLNREGVKSMLKVYAMGGCDANPAMDKLRDTAAQGDLDTWLQNKISRK